jgi:hypothetical protein
MKNISVDMDYLIFAYQDDSPDNAYYLDTEFGDIRLVNRNLSDLKDLTDEIELSQGRFLYVPKPPKEILLSDLRTFWQSITDKHLKDLLALSFETESVASTFKSILSKNPEERKRLDHYLNEKNRARVCLWLQANALDPEGHNAEKSDL